MAQIEKTLSLVWKLEYSDDAKRALEKNPGETGLTYKGIYETAHPEWMGWEIVKAVLMECSGDMKTTGVKLESNGLLQGLVTSFYKDVFWDKMKLDYVDNQHTASEIMIFGINAGCGKAIKLAQTVIGVTADGVIGPMTLQSLNKYDANKFDIEFDNAEKAYYQKLVDGNPKFKIFANGWRSRAEYV